VHARRLRACHYRHGPALQQMPIMLDIRHRRESLLLFHMLVIKYSSAVELLSYALLFFAPDVLPA